MENNMIDSNTVELEIAGAYALFSDPVMRVGGEKCSYQIPTYEACKGILASIYWKPTFIWVIDECRVMNRIQMESKGIRTLKYNKGGADLSYYTYLKNVRYQIRAHFEWNENHPQFTHDRDVAKHYNIAKKMIKRGGRRDVFLGARECQGDVSPCRFGEGKGAYDNSGKYPFGFMYHGVTYADEAYSEATKDTMTLNFWHPVMENGVIKFARPNECPEHKIVCNMKAKIFEDKKDNLQEGEVG